MINHVKCQLHANQSVTLVVATAQGDVRCYHQRGVADLLHLVRYHHGGGDQPLRGATVADKAVGKAAAACMIVGGVKAVWADVISQPALQLLQRAGIAVGYGTLAHHIINRAGTGWCPLERLTADCDDPAQIVALAAQWVEQQQGQQQQGQRYKTI